MANIPIRELVITRMATALAAMTVAGGYYYDVAAGAVTTDPSISLLTAHAIGLKPAYTVQPEIGGSREYKPADQVRDTFVATVTGRYDVDDLDPFAKLRAWERMAADIEKCLAPRADGTTVWHGGLIVDARFDEPQPFVAIGSPIVLLVQQIRMPLWRGLGQPSVNV